MLLQELKLMWLQQLCQKQVRVFFLNSVPIKLTTFFFLSLPSPRPSSHPTPSLPPLNEGPLNAGTRSGKCCKVLQRGIGRIPAEI